MSRWSRKVTRDRIVHVQAAFDYAQAVDEAKRLLGDIERLEERRLRLGQLFIRVRKQWPAHGPKAKGWSNYLNDVGVTQPTAWRYMELVGGVVDKVPFKLNETPTTEGISEIFSEISHSDHHQIGDETESDTATYAEVGIVEHFPQSEGNPIPTYAEVGIVGPPASVSEEFIAVPMPPIAAPMTEPEPEIEVSDEERQAAYRREVEASQPPKMEVREKQAHEVINYLRDARIAVLHLAERDVHLTDVTTSPEDFMRAKQLAIDIVNRLLHELDAAGVLDGKEGRRQMKLFKGGLEE
jgi:hypothetical protein